MIKIIQGDCLEELKKLKDNSVDSIVTDPPYELGFMGKKWDNTGIANNKEMWAECLRVLKPGGHLLSFSGTRTYHRMASAIEDAGFEIRDMIEWVYATGFPKSLNIGKAVDKLRGSEREVTGSEQKAKPTFHSQNVGGKIAKIDNIEITKGTSEWEGWGTALKPAHEPICMARKPLGEKTVAENVLKYGTGGIDIDGSRVETNEELGRNNNARTEGTSYVVQKETMRIDNSKGKRFPANLIHDNSEEVRECFPETKTGGSGKLGTFRKAESPIEFTSERYVTEKEYREPFEGNASRFFKSIIYQAKASRSERNKGCEGLEEKFAPKGNNEGRDMSNPKNHLGGMQSSKMQNNHPTVKPIALMEYLINMVTPKGGTVLDPFMGSGTTGVACKKLNRDFIGIELEPEYIKIAKARIGGL